MISFPFLSRGRFMMRFSSEIRAGVSPHRCRVPTYYYICVAYCRRPLPHLKPPIYVSAVVVKNKAIPRITMLYCIGPLVSAYYTAEFAAIKTRSWGPACHIIYIYIERERDDHLYMRRCYFCRKSRRTPRI